MKTVLAINDLTKSDRRGHLVNDGVTLSAEAGHTVGMAAATGPSLALRHGAAPVAARTAG